MRNASFEDLSAEVMRALEALAAVEGPLYRSLRRLSAEHRRNQDAVEAMWAIFGSPAFEDFAAWRQERRSGIEKAPGDSHWVYVISDGNSPHKIGRSVLPQGRQYNIRAETGRSMRVVFALPCGSRAGQVESLALRILDPFRQGRSEMVHAPLAACVAAIEYAHQEVFRTIGGAEHGSPPS